MAAPVNAVTDTVLVVVVDATELALLVVEGAEMLLLAEVGTDFVVGEEVVALTEVEGGLDEDVKDTGAIVEVDTGVADSEVSTVAVAGGKVKLRRLAQLEGASELLQQ